MGVPKFYRWLSERYPQINQIISDSTMLPEIDNFYLDMNGIIHHCTHPEEQDVSKALTPREMMLAIFRYIDRCVTEIVKPKKLLYMAIDGVAPRAKLNQQRARRFRSAQDREDSIIKAKQRGETVDEENMFDSNCITPGTEFMNLVCQHIKYFIRKKVRDDPLWQKLEIVFSGGDVPGEGEHKIMQFIRDARCKPGYQPNLRHCMYGQDADLIMLGLACHEPHFILLREVIQFNNNFGGKSARQTVIRQTREAQFQLLHLSVLREYIEVDIARDLPNQSLDKERIIDDFIFMTFLVGNDFLPHLPTLDISEQAFDTLFDAYKKLQSTHPGYLVSNGEIEDITRLEKFLSIIGSKEYEILSARENDMRKFSSKRKNYVSNAPTLEELEEAEEVLEIAYQNAISEALGRDIEGDAVVLELATGPYLPVKAGRSNRKAKSGSGGKPREDEDDDDAVPAKDYRGRYYFEKFRELLGSEKSNRFLDDLVYHYLQGLLWCLAYYSKGCISWTWYFPYHYGPMLQDMKDLNKITPKINFVLGNPFKPFQQLLGCIPPGSKRLLPRSYQWLMTSNDSPILEYYPTEFGVDMNGKKNAWEAVIVLPFIDEKRLLEAEALYCNVNLLTEVEVHRNTFGVIYRYQFDPNVTITYPSCNREIGLPDIINCRSKLETEQLNIHPGVAFVPRVIPGTVSPYPGFPSLSVLAIQSVELNPIKLNIFGSDSKYKTMVFGIKPFLYNEEEISGELLSKLIGKTVFVNFPMSHEAKIKAITTKSFEYKVDENSGNITHIPYDKYKSEKWAKESEEEALKFIKGRGIPGSGGLNIGPIHIRLRVVVLQGMKKSPETGARIKQFGTKEIEVPIQLVCFEPPIIADKRFEETEAVPVEKLLPFGSSVIGTKGNLLGLVGKVVGPHDASGKKVSSKRSVHVEFKGCPPEPPFGHLIANNVKDKYFASSKVCKLLEISPQVLGQLAGSIFLEGSRLDLGLNFRRNGVYYCPGYVARRQEDLERESKENCWKIGDLVQIIGSIDPAEKDSSQGQAGAGATKDSISWEYSQSAINVIAEYKFKYPKLFESLRSIQFASKYSADKLLGPGGNKKAEEIHSWIDSLPMTHIPRIPYSTYTLSKDAIAAIERAADSQREAAATASASASTLQETYTVKHIPIQDLFYLDEFSQNDTQLTYNMEESNASEKRLIKPALGDRIVNLNAQGVPFGLKGTVITIHEVTGYVEVLFDEEFTGGKSLNGSCSAFRGRLVAWTSVLLIPYNNKKKQQQEASIHDKIEASSESLSKKQLTEKQIILLNKIATGKKQTTNQKESDKEATKKEKLEKILSIKRREGEKSTSEKISDPEPNTSTSQKLQKVLKIMKPESISNTEPASSVNEKLHNLLKIKTLPKKLETEQDLSSMLSFLNNERMIEPKNSVLIPSAPLPLPLPLSKKEKRQETLIASLTKLDITEEVNVDGILSSLVGSKKKSDGTGAAALFAAAAETSETPTTQAEKVNVLDVSSVKDQSYFNLAAVPNLLLPQNTKTIKDDSNQSMQLKSTAIESTKSIPIKVDPKSIFNSVKDNTSTSNQITSIKNLPVQNPNETAAQKTLTLKEKLENARKALTAQINKDASGEYTQNTSGETTNPTNKITDGEAKTTTTTTTTTTTGTTNTKSKDLTILKPSIVLLKKKK